MINDSLTEKQEKFCLYYIKNFNATQSYLKAYGGKNSHVASVEGSKNLVKPSIKKRIRELINKQNKTLFLKSNRVLNEMVKIAFSDIGDYVRWHSKEELVIGAFGPITDSKTGKPIKKIVNRVEAVNSDEVDTTLVSEVSQGKDGFKIKMVDKWKAMEYLIKHFDLFNDEFKRELELQKLELEIVKNEKEKEVDKNKIIIKDNIPEEGN